MSGKQKMEFKRILNEYRQAIERRHTIASSTPVVHEDFQKAIDNAEQELIAFVDTEDFKE